MNAGITRDLQCTKEFLDSVLFVHGEGIAGLGEGRKSEVCLSEITEDILCRVSMPELSA
jgi:hypothetical protein